MLCPELLPANACSFMALIHLLWFLFEFFPLPSSRFLSVPSPEKLWMKSPILSLAELIPLVPRIAMVYGVFRRVTASEDCPASTIWHPVPVYLGLHTETSQPNEHKQGARPASTPAFPHKVAVFSDSAAPEKLPQDLPIVLNNRF